MIPINEGQHYGSSRGTVYTVKYLNNDIVVLYDGRNHRMDSRDYFEELIESGYFKHRPDINIRQSSEEIPFEEIDGLGEVAIESLENSGYTTPELIDRTSDEKIMKCRAVGEETLEDIKEFINNRMILEEHPLQ